MQIRILLSLVLLPVLPSAAQDLQNDTCTVTPSPAFIAPYGHTIHARINTKSPDARTGIKLQQGSAYRIESKGKVQDGVRLNPVTPDGYGPYGGGLTWGLLFEEVRFFGQVRTKSPSSTWFSLVGYVSDKPDAFVQIGERIDRWIPEGSGELVVFMNDVSGHYENNQGCVDIFVTRIP